MAIEDPRYPYTYACDHLRRLVGHMEGDIGLKISRSDASAVIGEIADVMNISKEEIAKKLADRFKEVKERGEDVAALTKRVRDYIGSPTSGFSSEDPE